MSPSYGYSYLASYGWTGTGTGLRKGAIARPLTIPQKKNLSGLGKDRDEAFPFWDHLFAAASKAITIKVSSDDEDDDVAEDPSSSVHTDSASAPLPRTTTGILSNRRPVSGTPASASGSTTPSLVADADADANANTETDVPNAGAAGRPSLLATAKREAAKRGLYARFFRGPVLGPDDGPHPRADATSHLAPSESSFTPTSTLLPDHVGDRQDAVGGETKKRKKRKSEDRAETKEEQRERKRLKRERKVARATKKAEKALAGDKAEKKEVRADRKARKHLEERTQSEENATTSHPKKARKHARKSVAGSGGVDLEQAEYTPKRLEKGLASTNNAQQDTFTHRPPSNVDATDASNIVFTTKKKGKRKDTPS